MKYTRTSPSMSYLIEIIIVLLFFSLSSAICVQIFVYARNTSDLAGDKQGSIPIMQNIVEDMKLNQQASETVTYYDEEWQPQDKKSDYRIQVKQQNDHYRISSYHRDEEIMHFDFSVYEKGESIYE